MLSLWRLSQLSRISMVHRWHCRRVMTRGVCVCVCVWVWVDEPRTAPGVRCFPQKCLERSLYLWGIRGGCLLLP